MSCSTFKTLSITYSDPLIDPVNGYIVKWRVAGDISWNTITGIYGNPIQIANIPACFSIEGTVQADCGNNSLSNPVNFAISASAKGCYTYVLVDSAVYTYTPCNQIQPVTLNNLSASPQSICAIEGSVSGGSYTRQNSCTTS
jgi:hypothetical protein